MDSEGEVTFQPKPLILFAFSFSLFPTHSSVLAWRIPGTAEAAVYGVAQSRTRLK